MGQSNTIEGAVADGVSGLFDISPIVTILVLLIILLLFFCKYLIIRNDRQNEEIIKALVENTRVIAAFKEVIRAKKD